MLCFVATFGEEVKNGTPAEWSEVARFVAAIVVGFMSWNLPLN